MHRSMCLNVYIIRVHNMCMYKCVYIYIYIYILYVYTHIWLSVSEACGYRPDIEGVGSAWALSLFGARRSKSWNSQLHTHIQVCTHVYIHIYIYIYINTNIKYYRMTPSRQCVFHVSHCTHHVFGGHTHKRATCGCTNRSQTKVNGILTLMVP